jgi:hypothetical protein
LTPKQRARYPRDWEAEIPQAQHSLLGRSPSLRSIYLDVLAELYWQMINGQVRGSGLTYDQARTIADDVAATHLLKLETGDAFADADFENGAVSQGAKILRRMETAEWFALRYDPLSHQSVVVLSRHAHKYAQLLQDYLVDPLATDAMLISILELLKQTKIPRLVAIDQSLRFTLDLEANLSQRVQQLVAFRPQVERLDGNQLAEWLGGLLDSAVYREYLAFRNEHVPEHWVADIRETLDQHFVSVEAIVAERYGRANLTPLQFEAERARVHSVLRGIEGHLGDRQHNGGILGLILEMDAQMRELARLYGQRQRLALNRAVLGSVVNATQRLMVALRERATTKSRRTAKMQLGLFRIRALGPPSLSFRSRTEINMALREQVVSEIAVPDDLELDDLYQYPDSDKVGEHFAEIFGRRETMWVSELMGDTFEETFWLARLLECCGATSNFGFEVVWTDPGPHTGDEAMRPILHIDAAPPLVRNEWREFSDVLIRRVTNQPKIENQ